MKIYTGNLASTTTESILKDAFAVHGAVETCSIPTDKVTGVAKNFGFVEMQTDTEANAAITALNDTDLGGNVIKVKESHSKHGKVQGSSPKN